MNSPNKALKRDSCRVAFLVCGWFGGKSGLRKVGLCGIHPLTQRYVSWKIDIKLKWIFPTKLGSDSL
ncbi:TPA: DUF3265 domain-containing protein [Vibrio vulnificus]|nr:DUF3265 domain-containing protein [Vibrio vulnificus]